MSVIKKASTRIVSFSILLICLALLFPNKFSDNWRSAHLDGAWQAAIHFIWERELVFGQDVVFTYGPLGVLSTRLHADDLWYWYVVSDLLFYAIQVTVFISIWRKLNTVSAQLAAFVVVLAINSPVTTKELALGLLFCSIFFIHRYLFTGQSRYLFLVGLLSIISFLNKLNAGLIGITLFLLTSIISARRDRGALVALFSFVIMLGLSSVIFPFSLWPYLAYGLEIAKGYSEAMVLKPQGWRIYSFHSAIWFLLGFTVVSILTLKDMLKDSRLLICWVWISAFTFLIFKQGFVRADNHVYTFMFWVAPVTGILFYMNQRSQAVRILFVFSLLISFRPERLDPEYWNKRVLSLKSYFENANNPKDAPEALSKLPEPFSSIIGDSSVDIIPHHIDLLVDRNYAPRPVIQSYAAYTGKLDRLNSKNLKAEYIMFTLGSIDGRYPWFDESRTKLALYEQYSPVLFEQGWILLKRREEPLSCSEKDISSVSVRPGKKVQIPESTGLVYADIRLGYSFKGYLEKFLFQPPVPQIDFHLKDGSAMSFRAIRPIIADSVLVSRFLDSMDDAFLFFSGNFESLRKVDKTRLYLETKSSFDEKVTYVFREVFCQKQ